MDPVATPAQQHAPVLDTPAPVRPAWAPLAVVAFVGLVVCSNVANAVWAGWIVDHPERVLLLSSRVRYLAFAVAADIGVVPYVVIGFVRLAAAFVVCHLIGRAYRDDVLRLFTRYLGVTPEAIDTYHRGLDKAETVIIPFFVGSNLIAALTGIRRTAPARLAVLLSAGIAARLALYWWLAKAFREPLERVLEWVDRYDRWVILASVVLVILVNVRNFRRGAA